MDGQTGQSRFPKGFLLADKENGRAWVYDLTGEGDEATFVCRDPAGAVLDRAGRLRAAQESTYDVRAL